MKRVYFYLISVVDPFNFDLDPDPQSESEIMAQAPDPPKVSTKQIRLEAYQSGRPGTIATEPIRSVFPDSEPVFTKDVVVIDVYLLAGRSDMR